MPPTQNSIYRTKKAQKSVFLPAGLRKSLNQKIKSRQIINVFFFIWMLL